MDFVGPIGERGVAFLMGGFGVGWEFVYVFKEPLGEGCFLACLLGFHELLDEAIAEGGLAVGEMMPEAHRFRALGGLPINEGGEVDAIEAGLVFDAGSGEGEDGGIDVGGDGWSGDCFWFEAGREFDEGGDAEAALVDGAFSLAAAGGFFDEAAVVGGVPEEAIVGDL